MRKSQMLARLLDLYHLSGSAGQIISEFEAAGMRWEPERLPEKLSFAKSEREPALRALCPVPEGWETEEQADAAYAEAVRRYNAWPELRDLSSALVRATPEGSNANDDARHLFAILDGRS